MGVSLFDKGNYGIAPLIFPCENWLQDCFSQRQGLSMGCLCRPIMGIRCDLGEGLVWDWKANCLFITDIVNNKVIEINISSGNICDWGLPEPAGWVLPTEKGGNYVVGLRSGIALFDLNDAASLRWLNREFPGNPQCRLNDACTDSTGRIWCGSMNFIDERSVDGKLASFSIREGLRLHDAGFAVTNGPLVAPDGQFMYFSDTLKGIIYRYSMSLIPGSISGREEFIRFGEGEGWPDGMCFDAEGNLWVAMWGAAKVNRVDPFGKLLTSIDIPALNVTNVCFAGENLDRMFVSSASIGMDPDESEAFPGAGQIFEIINHGTRGLRSHPFKGI